MRQCSFLLTSFKYAISHSCLAKLSVWCIESTCTTDHDNFELRNILQSLVKEIGYLNNTIRFSIQPPVWRWASITAGKMQVWQLTVPSVWPWKPVTVENYHSWVLHVLFSGYPSLSKHSNTMCKDCNFVRRASTVQNRSYERKECKFRFWSPAGLVYLSLSSELLPPWQFYVAFRQSPSTISRPEFHFWKDAGKGTCATPDSPTKVGSKKTWIGQMVNCSATREDLNIPWLALRILWSCTSSVNV